MVSLTEVTEAGCLAKCRYENDCAGLFLKDGQCYHLGMANQHSLQTENGTNFFKKINGTDFSKEALLQKVSDINCLKESNNDDNSCAFPYDYKGTQMYACTECGDFVTYSPAQVLSYIWSKSNLTSINTESNLGECKHQCNLHRWGETYKSVDFIFLFSWYDCNAIRWEPDTKVTAFGRSTRAKIIDSLGNPQRKGNRGRCYTFYYA